jgi:hypothetical protein
VLSTWVGEDIVDKTCAPAELSDLDLHYVAGGNPFSGSSVSGTGNINSGSFPIGAVFGDSSSAFGIFIGQLNIYFGTPHGLQHHAYC